MSDGAAHAESSTPGAAAPADAAPRAEGAAGEASGATSWLTAGLVSAGVLAFEVVVMRLLLIASWHHFAFLVISIALLGFGASGTALCLLRRWALRHAGGVLVVLAAATAASMPLCVAAAQHLPIEARFVPAMMWRQIGAWVGYWALLAIPFTLGGAVVGLALMQARQRVASVYAANLAGSGIGALAAPALMAVVMPMHLPIVTAAVTVLGAATVPRTRPAIRALAVAGAIVIGAPALLGPDRVQMDEFKYGSYVQRLVEQDDAELVADDHSAQGLVRVYRGDAFHDLPFLSVTGSPPAMMSITVDGHAAGSLLRADDANEASAVDHTLMAAPYALLPERPRVLLLGETGGSNIWLGRRHAARTIHVAQPHERLIELLRTDLAAAGGAIWRRADVATVTSRLFIERTERRFDLIQVVSLESLGVGGAGMGGLAEDHLLTVQGLKRCLDRLSDDGLLVACRGIQQPARDNVKYLATVGAALRATGVDDPSRHVAIVRDFLGVCTMVKPTPWTNEQIASLRDMIDRRHLTPVWFPGIRDAELNRPDSMPGPEGKPGDWYHHAARQLLTDAGDRAAFIDGWTFDIRPPTDDRPYFGDYFRGESIGAMRQAFGKLWLTRTELAYLFVAAATVLIAAAGAALTVLPLLAVREIRRAPGKWAAGGYFVALGLAYMAVEMTALSWLTRIIGQPVTAAAVTIAAFMLISGAGSWLAERVRRRRARATGLAVAVIVLWAVGLAAIGPAALSHLATLPLAGRLAIAMLGIAPLALAMGFPMPLGLARLDRGAPQLIPWAWGVNGFASVLAPPLATLIAMTCGWSVSGGAALTMYVAAAVLFGAVGLGTARAADRSAPPDATAGDNA